MAQPLNLLSAVDAGRAADDAVAWRGGAAFSRGEFYGRIAAWSHLLGATAGSAFALFHSDAIEFAAALFGAWRVRKRIFLPGDNLPGTCAGLSSSVAGFLGEFAGEWRPLTAPPENCALASKPFDSIDGDFAGLVLYTSGSTGAPQPIIKKFSQMAAEVANLEQQFGQLLGTAEIVTTVSHQHIYGLLFNILWPLAAGRRIQASSLSWFEDISTVLAERDAVLVSSPAQLGRLPENPAWAAAGARLRAVFSSGGPLSFEAAQHCHRLLGRAPIEVYGSSETGGIAWRQQQHRNDQAWTTLPGVQWRLKAQDEPHGDDEVLEVRSAHLPSKDWFRTADRARPAGDGQFFLGGRIDQIAKIEGKRISLSAIERLLMASPLVECARAIAVDGRRQRVAAFVVPSARGRGELDALGRRGFTRMMRSLLSQSIEAVGMPRMWRYLDALPVNARGKTSHAELLALLDARPARVTEPRARLIERDAERALYELVAPRELIYFDGHFDGQPILAGVVQVDWVIGFGRRCFDLPLQFRAMQALKFQRLIAPETPLRLELIYNSAKAILAFKLSTALGTHASGRLLFGDADDSK
jgi:acyl-CoA synthetase (AMP-forming)/AMP-acid ligase II